MPPNTQEHELAELIRAATAHEAAAGELRRRIAAHVTGDSSIVDPDEVDRARPDVVHIIQVTNPSDGTSRILGAFTTGDLAAAALDTPDGRALRHWFDDFGADQAADLRQFITIWPLNRLVVPAVDLADARDAYHDALHKPEGGADDHS